MSPTFRNLLLANVVSDIGTFMQTVGAAWLMVSLNAGPAYVALIQSASALPFFLVALPAGAIGDIFDRRRVILSTEIWMAVTASVLAMLTLAGRMSPLLLLSLTFVLSAGDAFESPVWRAVLPELVQKDDLPASSALNGIEFNLARTVGPALGGLLILTAGVGATFLINAISFLGVIGVVLRWRRIPVKRTTPQETVTGATAAALRQADPSVIGYSALLGTFGCGAVVGAMAIQRARRRFSTDLVVSGGIALFGLSTATAGILHSIWMLGGVMFVGGAAWVSFVSLFNVQVLNQAPEWVRARVLAIAMLVFQGGIAGEARRGVWLQGISVWAAR
jgi:MFS family permease